jgi:hypothetical protein
LAAEVTTGALSGSLPAATTLGQASGDPRGGWFSNVLQLISDFIETARAADDHDKVQACVDEGLASIQSADVSRDDAASASVSATSPKTASM